MAGLKTKNNFIERSILSALSFLKTAALSDNYSLRRGFLQSLDPRVKTISLLILLLVTVSLKNSAPIGVLYLICLLLTIASGIPITFFLIRTWVFIPLFSLCIVIPALFSFITPGEPLVSFSLFGIKLIITHQGFGTAVLFVMRVATSVSLVVLLSLTTRHAELLKVLRLFGVPQFFVLTASMCYRYLYLFAQMIESTFTAVKSRVGVVTCQRKGRHLTAWNMANTWNRSTQINEEVYRAMLSKGYTGEVRLTSPLRAGVKDWIFLLGALGLSAALMVGGRSL